MKTEVRKEQLSRFDRDTEIHSCFHEFAMEKQRVTYPFSTLSVVGSGQPFVIHPNSIRNVTFRDVSKLSLEWNKFMIELKSCASPGPCEFIQHSTNEEKNTVKERSFRFVPKATTCFDLTLTETSKSPTLVC